MKHILILQNKIDLIKEEQGKEQHEQILKFIEGTVAEGAPIIPISAQLKYNIEVERKLIILTYLGFAKPNSVVDKTILINSRSFVNTS